MMKAAIISLLAAALTACAAVPDPPSQDDVRKLENLRVIEPMASPTRRPGAYVAEFAPEIEIRDLVCRAEAPTAYRCHFESRVRPFLGAYGDWRARVEVVKRVGNQWRFGHTEAR